jgi:hypothetical protein
MKNFKTITAVAVIISLMLSIGCSEKSAPGLENAENRTDTVTADYEVEHNILRNIAPLSIMVSDDSDYVGELIFLVNTARIERANDTDDSYLYSQYEIADIAEFHCLKNLRIDGYQLYSITINSGVLEYIFASIDELEQTHIRNVLEIGFTRPGWYADRTVNQFEATLEQATSQMWGYLTEDGMIYSREHMSLVAQGRGNSTIRIEARTAPKFNTYESMRDLMFEILRTAELVNVDEEIGRLAAE